MKTETTKITRKYKSGSLNELRFISKQGLKGWEYKCTYYHEDTGKCTYHFRRKLSTQ